MPALNVLEACAHQQPYESDALRWLLRIRRAPPSVNRCSPKDVAAHAMAPDANSQVLKYWRKFFAVFEAGYAKGFTSWHRDPIAYLRRAGEISFAFNKFEASPSIFVWAAGCNVDAESGILCLTAATAPQAQIAARHARAPSKR